jgi:hypothetical protein
VSRGFDQLVDIEGLEPDDVSRLRRVHDLLVAAGPPADLPTSLRRPPADLDGAQILEFPARRRRPAALLIIAATVAAACFGGGYIIANQAHTTAAIHVVRVVSLEGEHNSLASASLSVGSADVDGNWPIELKVSGLPQPQNARYYLMLWRNGKPGGICGTFRSARTTSRR